MSTEDLPRILTTAWRVSLAQEMAEEPAIRPEDVARVVKWCKEQAYLPPVSGEFCFNTIMNLIWTVLGFSYLYI